MEHVVTLYNFVVEHWKEITGVIAVAAGLYVELRREWKDVKWVAEKLGL